jgi:UDP-N-acetylmuramoyl-tripeptide--D-alanyl-D-alanine ligase
MRIKLSISLTLREIAAILNCPARSDDEQIEYVTTDTREIEKGDLFIALFGEKHNGEDFIDEAKEKGAYTVSKRGYTFSVKSGNDALLTISEYYLKKLKRLRATVGITGSVGKSTAKETLYKMLMPCYKTHANTKNYNNEFGVSFTVLSAPIDTEILILEMGMNHAGEIRKIASAIVPDFAIITNIKDAHIGNLGSREAIRDAKLEIKSSEKTHLILPYDEPLLADIDKKTTVSCESPEADIYLSVINDNGASTLFDVFCKKCTLSSQSVTLTGRAYMEAIASSVAVCELLGLGDKEISDGLKNLDMSISHKKIYPLNSYTIIDDTYSASPAAVLYELKEASKYSPVSCVLGDMLELGAYSKEKHRKIGAFAYHLGYRRIYAFGKYACEIANGALEAGMDIKCIHQNTDLSSPKNTAYALFMNIKEGETVLFKGSRRVGCERIIALFENMILKNNKGDLNA